MLSLPYKSFAIFGAARSIGRYIFDALHERKASIVAITRSSSSADTTPKGVKIVKIDVVVSSIKLLVPSEYGLSTEGDPEGLWETGDNVAESAKEHMKEIGLPSARFFTGMLFSLISTLSGYTSTGKINAVGAGKTPASWTADEDIGGIFGIEGERLTLGRHGQEDWRPDSQSREGPSRQ
ncbi:hypothetical protein DFS33DRAFT_1380883 [Desarmillaria ectypa]|nr:hypothetical protein DFS33DRAFT_1380883 [Desarmillaria ectypa]